MLDAKLADDIVAAVDSGFADQVTLTQEVVRAHASRHRAVHRGVVRGGEGFSKAHTALPSPAWGREKNHASANHEYARQRKGKVGEASGVSS